MALKLAYLVPEFPSQTHIFFWREICALRRMGVEVRLVSTRRPVTGSCRHEFAAQAMAQTHYLYPPRVAGAVVAMLMHPGRARRGIAYALGCGPPGRMLGLELCATDLLRFCKREQIDHLHAHSCADAAHVAAMCHIMGGPPYSLTLHGDLAIYGSDHRRKMAHAKFVCYVAPHLRQQIIEEAAVAQERLLHIWMGLETDVFTDMGSRSGQDGTLELLTVARLHAAKGHEHAIAAVKTVLDRGYRVRYRIAGEGPERPQIEALIARLGVGERVRLLGTVSEQEILALMGESDAVILASKGMGEAWPVCVMEGMSCGRAVIASRVGATPLMIDDGTTGLLVPAGDEAALAEAIIRLCGDASLRQRLGRAARAHAAAEFDVNRTAARLLEAVRAPVSPGHPGEARAEASPVMHGV